MSNGAEKAPKALEMQRGAENRKFRGCSAFRAERSNTYPASLRRGSRWAEFDRTTPVARNRCSAL
jgi:hypothetical protein